MTVPPFGKKIGSGPVRQHPRFRTKPLHDLSFQIESEALSIKIANISLGGLGLFANPSLMAVKSEFEGVLTVGDKKFNVTLKKAFQDENLVGCSFENPASELQSCIDTYFQTEIHALRLVRVETIPDRNNKQDKVIYFHGQNNCELLINERNSQICYFSVVIFGNSLEVDPKKKLQSGQRIADPELQKRTGVTLFKPLETSTHIVENATRFIDNIEELSAVYRESLIKLLLDTSTKAKQEKVKPSQK